MLKISRAQWQLFSDDVSRRFENSMIEHIEKAYPEEVWDMDELTLRERIRSGIERASQYGVKSEEDVSVFIELEFELGTELAEGTEHEWAHEILANPALDGHTKILDVRESIDELEEDADAEDDSDEGDIESPEFDESELDEPEAWDLP